jgi:hypothetical protein
MKTLEGMTTARSEFDTLADGQVADVTRLIRSPRDWREVKSVQLRRRQSRRSTRTADFHTVSGRNGGSHNLSVT